MKSRGREGIDHLTCRLCNREFPAISWAHLVYRHRLNRATAIADYVRRFRLKTNWSIATINRGRRSTLRRYESLGRRWTRDRVKREIRELRKRGELLHFRRMEKAHPGLLAYGIRLLGSWNRALAAAGIRPELVRRRIPRTRQDMLAALRRDALAGKDVSHGGLMARDSRLCHVINKHFGGVAAALKLAGIDPVKAARHRRWTRSMILEEIRSIDWKTLDRTSIYYQRLQKAARAHFGGWKKALQRVGMAEWAWKPL